MNSSPLLFFAILSFLLLADSASAKITEVEIQKTRGKIQTVRSEIDEIESKLKENSAQIKEATDKKETDQKTFSEKTTIEIDIQSKLTKLHRRMDDIKRDHVVFEKTVAEEKNKLKESEKQIKDLEELLLQLKESTITLLENIEVGESNLVKMTVVESELEHLLALTSKELAQVAKEKSELHKGIMIQDERIATSLEVDEQLNRRLLGKKAVLDDLKEKLPKAKDVKISE